MDIYEKAVIDRATALVSSPVVVRLRGGGADVTGTLTSFGGVTEWEGMTPCKAVLVVTDSSSKVWYVRVDDIAAIGG
jgi:hypothetical protein